MKIIYLFSNNIKGKTHKGSHKCSLLNTFHQTHNRHSICIFTNPCEQVSKHRVYDIFGST